MMSPTRQLGVVGFGLIAVCYGFARFAFGLFLPQIREDLVFSSTLAGVISGGSFLAFCMTILLSAYLTERIGGRAVAVAAALTAAVGMLGIAMAPSSVWLAVAVMLAGFSTGLASPPMAAAVAHVVDCAHQDVTNTVINAGTSAGVALSGAVALAAGSDWRMVFALFSAIALAMAAFAFFIVPSKTTADRLPANGGSLLLNPSLARLVGATFLMGASSTALWSFGAELASAKLEGSGHGTGLLWTAIGAAGIFGAGAGSLIARWGINKVHRFFLIALAAGICASGLAFTTPTLTLIGGALFGAAYIMLTGVYLVWGVCALPDRPATGLMIGFLTMAIGQTAGAPFFGLIMSKCSVEYAVFVFAGLGLLATLLRFKPVTIRRGEAF